MRSTSLTRTLALVVMAGATVFSTGCFGGTNGVDVNPTREGLDVPINGLHYNIFMTRQLNALDPEDKAYYQGQVEDPQCAPDSGISARQRQQKCPTNLYGVFIRVCNFDGGTHTPAPANASGFKIEDSQGNEYDPLPLLPSNLFAYRVRPLIGKHDCIPESGSTADTAPIAGSVFVFRLPVQATENRPLEMTISSGGKTKKFELDI
jgi:hypothetical protein